MNADSHCTSSTTSEKMSVFVSYCIIAVCNIQVASSTLHKREYMYFVVLILTITVLPVC